MRVGLLTDSLSSRAGGLLYAISGLSRALTTVGVEVELFAGGGRGELDAGGPWSELASVPSVLPVAGPRAFGYVPALQERIGAAGLDLLHTHGLWMYPSVAARAWRRHTGRPTLVTPHGMLDPWAVRHSGWKKRLAGWLYENAHLRGSDCLHALCEAEHQAIRGYGLRNPVAVIPNGVDLPDGTFGPPAWAARLPRECRVLLFLGRLHPKKGLASLLRAWAAVQERDRACVESWRLVVAGWDQLGHQDVLRSLTADLGVDDSILFVGPQFGVDKGASLARADAFVLPSHSEGLPMAVLEAWAYNLPVLMTDACNLSEGFSAGAALRLPLDEAGMTHALGMTLGIAPTALRAIGMRGRRLVEERFDWLHIGAEMAAVYRWLIGAGGQPSCIRFD